MKLELLEILRCPQSGQRLKLEGDQLAEIDNGWLVTIDGRYRYPIRNRIPRFVPESNYADNFGMQWNHFRTTQLDSHSQHPISSNRFWGATGWQGTDLKGQWVLDAGCGAGRFAEVAAKAGAKIVALDYSSAADACYSNLKHHSNLHVVQGDIYSLPFQREAFAFVYSLGVLQHTPDVRKAFESLPAMLQPEGKICVDYYEKSWRDYFHARFWLRPITKRMPQQTLFGMLRILVPIMLPLSRAVRRIPIVGKGLSRLVPVVNYEGILPLTRSQHDEWSLLDTFDWLGPKYDQPQTPATARLWMENAQLREIEILKVGHLVARGHK